MPATGTARTWLAAIAVAVCCACGRPAQEGRSLPEERAATSVRPADDEVPRPSSDGTLTRGDSVHTPAQAATRAWTVDLRRDESLGGHTMARHVGRTDGQLRARLARESIAAASTYPDLEQAERVVALALEANERRVRRWIDRRGPRSNLAIRYRARDGLPTGRMLRRGAAAPEDVSGAVVVLRWRTDHHYVLTSYPETVR